ncbi:MAG: hypothetical protein Q4C83_00580 [Candidatus Saccharibacteria bacterium]|nr:hypothetical protein [Candidatus Saccharibacteria bacterium]
MLIAIERIIGAPVMSLQTGQPLCKLTDPIVNPYNLRIVAFYVDGPRLDFTPAVVFAEDIREFGSLGAIVDSVDNVMSPKGMVRLNDVMKLNFHLRGALVVDDNGHKLGKVDSYVVDMLNFEISQLHVKPSIFKSFASTGLSIGRQQIIKIEPHRITVKSPDVKVKAAKPVANNVRRPLNPDFENPFRKNKPVLNNIDTSN